jgi:hypothetical protein
MSTSPKGPTFTPSPRGETGAGPLTDVGGPNGSPDDELEAVIPREVLEALDEPLDLEDDDAPAQARRPLRTSLPAASMVPRPYRSEPPSRVWRDATPHPMAGASKPDSRHDETGPGQSTTDSRLSSPPRRMQVAAEPARLGIGHALSLRASGVLVQQVADTARQVVLREGDLITIGSELPADSLLMFLVHRGDLPADAADSMSGRFPLFGKLAGAALVARGFLVQEELWPTLQAHSEWLLCRVLQSEEPVVLQEEVPRRMLSEPATFGATPGPAAFLDAIRRIVGTDEANTWLGRGKLAWGSARQLLGECGLTADETRVVEQMVAGQPESVGPSVYREISPLIQGLSYLGVVTRLAQIGPSTTTKPAPSTDEEATLRARIDARLRLVAEADYFAILGVGKDATGYEIRRAHLAARRLFEPNSLGTLAVERASDVARIRAVLDEAYEILRDDARRQRYRRALEA